jgi:hypothetical protein
VELGRPHEWIAASLASLAADPDLYSRDAELVHVTRVTEEESRASAWVDARGRTQHALVPGAPRIHAMTLATLRVLMCRWATWTKTKMVRTKEGPVYEDVPFEPTKDHAEAVRDERHWPTLRGLAGVAEVPFPRPDLSIVQGERGYDRATGYLYEPSARFPIVGDAPSRDEAHASRAALADVFADFPFASPAGLGGALALLLTLLVRPAILGPVPAWIIDATTPGTGKSLLADVCAAVAFGRDAGRDPFPSSARNGDDELRKQLGFLARTGTPLVNFDNCDDVTIGSDSLEQIISAPRDYRFRVLGVSDGLLLPVRMLFVFTANNAAWSRGMSRRILHVRLESPFADPEHRPLDSYEHPERAGRLMAHVLEHRGELVRHALTIVRAYAAAGCPDRMTVGTFEAWAALVPSALVWAGAPDPMLCRPGSDGEENPDMAQRAALAREWAAYLFATSLADVTAHDIITALYPRREKGEALDPKWDTLRGAIEHFVPTKPGAPNPDPRQLGDAIGRKLAGAPIRTHDAPAPLRKFVRGGKSGGRARWKVDDVPAYAVKSRAPADPLAELVERLRAEEKPPVS